MEQEMGTDTLLTTLKGLVNNVKPSMNKVGPGSTAPTASSKPTGSKWTLDALSKNIKSAFSFNTDIFDIPLKKQLILITAITERLLSKHAPVNDRNNTFETADLPKPFTNYVGHKFRTADGSGNSLLFPDVGKAGTNYTRTVTSMSPNNEHLPDPKDIFRKVMKRPEGVFNPHQGGINMFLLYLAILITHDLFYTDPHDPTRNMTTSYVDLSPLYGFDREGQESIREMRLGLIKPDQWVDKRLVIQPSGVASLLVMFSRNHNFIAKKLLEINENGRFSLGPGQRFKTSIEQDEELFQTARLINTGCYANIVIHEYLRTILGTTADSDFVLNPLADASPPIYGNAVSIEFNAVYRWHSAIGHKDDAWLTEVMKLLMTHTKECQAQERHPGLDRSFINKKVQSGFDEMLANFNAHFVHATEDELKLGLPIAGAHRDLRTGKFADQDLVRALRDGYEQPASEIGNGLNTPAALEHVEIAGINQGRILNTCYFNEFRKFLNLTTLDTFADFSEKIEVQKGLEELYGTPDRVELYVGLMIERAKPTGLRLPYTMGRAILSDATNLLRNDRILVQELTPANLTNWGYHFIQGDPQLQGRVLPAMMREAFPDMTPEKGGFSAEELRTIFTVPKRKE
ncbi:heme peroxidase [Pilobolus umbonatus]|nr:heme peroxidase [Pilobolus umbonatus]